MSYLEIYFDLVLALHKRGLNAPEVTWQDPAILRAMLDRVNAYDNATRRLEKRR